MDMTKSPLKHTVGTGAYIQGVKHTCEANIVSFSLHKFLEKKKAQLLTVCSIHLVDYTIISLYCPDTSPDYDIKTRRSAV